MISVIIPSHNERERLPPTLSEIEMFCMENEYVTEVIVVDDASIDQTVERAMYYHNRIPGFQVVRHDENKGKWGAIRTGIQNASNDACLLLDADGSASIWELQNLSILDTALKHRIPVFGTRFAPDSKVEGKSFVRNVVSHGYRLYVRFWYWYATGRSDIDDMQCPFKLIFKSDVSDITVQQYAGDIELACGLERKVVNHPVHFIHKQGGSVGVSTMLQMAIDTAKVALDNRKEHKGEENRTHNDVHNDVPEDNNTY